MRKVSDFAGRLRALMEERGLSYDALGELLGMHPQTLNRYALGKREPKAGVSAVIALALGVDALWLQGYDAPRLDLSLPKSTARTGYAPMLPVLDSLPGAGEGLPETEPEGYAAADVPDPERCFYLRAGDDSMEEAGIRTGDLVLVRRQECAESGRIAACFLEGSGTCLRRVYCQGDLLILQAAHAAYAPTVLPAGGKQAAGGLIVGVAVKLVRTL
ncbi:LexA repressor [bioreactor metagenome]|uniref:LexA repressor n=1 Tax=bioreactor metagenome TaxID=1076179 RepID=A0A644YRD9_9ZZZZ